LTEARWPGEDAEAEEDEGADPRDVPRVPTESGVADELDAVVQRVELACDLRPLRQLAQREERARDEEERREDGADDVAEVLDRGGVARDCGAEARPAEAGEEGDQRHGEHPR
jgi:hypothetical protein